MLRRRAERRPSSWRGLGDAGRRARLPAERALAARGRRLPADLRRRASAASAAPRSSRGRPSCCSCCASTARTGDAAPLDMVVQTLRAMAAGGMRDHVGGGFHRYSVDAQWRVPHFEKMLYDQAQLALACLEAAQATGDRVLARGGGGHAAIRAARPDRRRRRLLLGRGRRQHPAGRAGRAATRPRVRSTSGRPPRSTGCSARTRRSCGSLRRRGAGATRCRIRRASSRPEHPVPGVSLEDAGRRRAHGRCRERGGVPRAPGAVRGAERAAPSAPRRQGPDRVERPDDRRLRAGGPVVPALDPGAADRGAAWLAMAERAAAFIRARMWQADTRRLLRRYRDGEAAIDGYAEDYACPVFGLLELFQADGDAALAGVGAGAAAPAGRAVLGRGARAAGSAPPATTPRC